MRAIRGATTVSFDEPQQIKTEVARLLDAILVENHINKEEISFILFSNTSDVRSFYPAKAAREAGFFECPLFSAAEPEIDDSLPMCIRVLALCEGEGQVKHVYLNGAKKLRRDISENINVAIDGPAGSGKSTVSKLVAKQLGILCLDTGAMYRACALKCKKEGISVENAEKVAEIVENIDLKVELKDGIQHTFLDGADVSEAIRSGEISMLASTVSKLAAVREKMVSMQREIAAKCGCVLDGRDIGTNVLPNADFKFFLTATPEIRAKRRLDENAAKGIKEDFSAVLKEINARDEQDRTRKIAPLKKADEAVEIDTSDMTADEVANAILKTIQERV